MHISVKKKVIQNQVLQYVSNWLLLWYKLRGWP